MKKKIWTVIFLIFICIYSYAQRGSKASAAAATTSATATQGSGSTTLIQGYHYRLDRNYHIGYKSILYTSLQGVIQNPPGQAIKIYNIFDYILTDSVTKTDGTIPKVYPKNVFYPGDSLRVEVMACHWNEGSAHDIKDSDKDKGVIIIRDTISRYYFKKLWISVTQGDSGKLVIQFYNTRIQKQFWKKGEAFQGDGKEFNPDRATIIKKNFSNLIDTSKFHVALGGDKTLNTAIPINNLDSAQNFFLKIKNKVHFSDPLYYISLPYYVWQYGAATIPFKLRFGNSKQIINVPDINKLYTLSVPTEATTSFNLATYIGYKMGKTHFYYDQTKSHNTVSLMVACFAGISSTTLTNNNIKYVPDTTTPIQAGSTTLNTATDLNKYPSMLLSVSPGLSATVEYGPINLGFFAGADFPLQHTQWVYGGKLWIGFGIGFNLGMFTSAGNVGL